MSGGAAPAGPGGAARRGLIVVALLLATGGAAPGEAAGLPRLGPAPNFALTTPQNDRVWLTQLRDRVVVLTFGCTTCQSCPRLLPALDDLARAGGEAAGRRVFFVVVTLDPERDSPAILRQFARARGLVPPAWLFLTGSRAEIEIVSRRYGVGVERRDGRVAHDCRVTLVDAGGTVRGRYDESTLGRLATDLSALLGEPGHR